MRTHRLLVVVCIGFTGCSPQFDHLPPAPPSAYVGAETALRKGDFAAAEAGFSSYLESSPDLTYRARAYYRLAQTQYGAKKYREALRSLETLREEFPEQNGPQIPALEGDAYAALGNPLEAVLHWETAWSRASQSDQEYLRPRLAKAIDDLDAVQADQLAGMLSEPEVKAMLAERSPGAGRTIAAAPKPMVLEPEPIVAPQPPPVEPEEEAQPVAEPPAAAPPQPAPSAAIGEVWNDNRAAAPAGGGRPSAAEVEAGVGHRYLTSSFDAEHQGQLAVGCLLPLTGKDRAAGRRALNGLRLAFEGSPYAVAVQDTGSDPEIARLLIRKLASDSYVLATVGPNGDADATAVAPLADQLALPLLLLSGSDGLSGHYVLQAATTRRQQVRAVVGHATRVLGASRFGVLYPDDEEGRAFVGAFESEVRQQNGTIIGSRGYRPGQTSFEREAAAVGTWSSKDEVQAVFIPDQAETATAIAAAIHAVAPSVVLLGSESWNDAPALARAGEAVEGAVFAGSFHPLGGASGTQSFVSEFRQRAGDLPTGLEAQAYDAGMLVRRALENGADTRQDMLAALRATGSYDGAGRIRTAADAFEREPLLLRVRGGTIEEIPG